MKFFCKLLLLVIALFCYNINFPGSNALSAQKKTITTKAVAKASAATTAITASITAKSTSVCLNATTDTITFTANGGTAPYTFTYTINGGNSQTVISTSGNSSSVTVPTSAAGTFLYSLNNVADATGASQTIYSTTATVTVHTLPTITGATSLCQGGTNISLSGSGTAASTNAWVSSDPTIVSIVTGNIIKPSAINAGTATITYTDNNGCTATQNITVNPLPTIDFTFLQNQCAGQPIQFTEAVTGTGTFTYSWAFGDGTTSTDANPTHRYDAIYDGTPTKTYTPILTATNTATGCSKAGSQNIIVTRTLDASLSSITATGAVTNGVSTFTVCGTTTATEIDFTNASTTTAYNTNYTIDWGDSSSPYTGSTLTTVNHLYNIGLYTLTFTVKGSIGCDAVKTYQVFVGANPNITLTNPGSTTRCITDPITFPISTTGNPPGTTYTVTFNDGSPAATYDNSTLPSSITHTFLKTSCGASGSSYSNSFYAKVVASNLCGKSNGLIEPIYISDLPQASYTLPKTLVCTNVPITLTNTSPDNTQVSSSGACSTSRVLWYISGTQGTDYTISGSKGTDNGFHLTATKWTSGANTLTITFAKTGTYTLKMLDGGACTIDSMTKTICVSDPIVPQFTVDQTEICAGGTITTTNTTDISKQCSTPTYNWSVSYLANYCGSSPAYTYAGGTLPNSVSPAFTFTNPGKYIISVTSTTECGTHIYSQMITVKQAPSVTITPISAFCGTASFIPTASINSCAPASSTLTYMWSFPGANTTTSTAASPGTITYSSPGTYNVALAVTNECGTTTAAPVTFTVNPIPAVTNGTLSQTTCSNVSTSAVTLTGNPATGTTFTWTTSASGTLTGYPAFGAGDIPSATLLNSGTSSGNVVYHVTPHYLTCNGSTTDYTITVKPQPVISTQPTSVSLCQTGTMPALSVAVTNIDPGDTPSYQWYQNSTNSTSGGTAVGTNTSTYMPDISSVGTNYYYCIISFAGTGANCASVTSAVATVTVTPSPSIDTQPVASQSACVGGTVSTPLAVTYINGAGIPSYQWYDGSGAIPGATSDTYTPPVYTATGTYNYYVTIVLAGSGCAPVTSTNATVNIVSSPTISTQPLSTQTLCLGAVPTDLSVTATGGVGPNYSYQWYSNSANNNTTGSLITGETNQTFTPPTSGTGTTYYYCVVTQPSGPGCSIVSNQAEVIIAPQPSFTRQPTSSDVCIGGTPLPVTVATTGGISAPTYQWFSNSINSNSGGTLIPGATSATYNFTPATTTGATYYYCEVTYSGGSCNSITSNTAKVNVNPKPIAAISVPSQSLCEGTGLVAPLSVSYTGGSGTATYQWYYNSTNSNSGGAMIGGATGYSYMPGVFTTSSSNYYYAEVTLSGNGCGSATSDVGEVSVVADPVITSSALSQSYCKNATASPLSVSVTGGIGTTSYQWYYNGSNSNSGGTIIPGATSAAFTPSTITVGIAYYYCKVTQTGLGCDATSPVFSVTTQPTPSIVTQPASSTICLGATPAQLIVTAINGVGTPSYQWYLNSLNNNTTGIPVSGETNNTYNPPSTSVGTNYYYAIVSYSAGGCNYITSGTAAVTVNPVPFIGNKTALIVSGATFSVVPNNVAPDIVPAGTTYTWTLPAISPAGAITGASAQTTAQTGISQTLTNNTTSPATVTYTVTPKTGNCPGTSFTVTVTVNPSIRVVSTVTNCTCFGVNNGAVGINIAGGIPFITGDPYHISWTGPNGYTSTTTNISGLEPGTYTLRVEDDGGFPFTQSYTVTQPDDIVINTTAQANVTCNGAGNGKISINVTGGTAPYAYGWTKGGLPYIPANPANLTNLTPDTYIVTVNDANSCGPKTTTYTITEPAALTSSVTSTTNVLCYGDATGAISIQTNGGTQIEVPPGVFDYKYFWNGPGGFTSTQQNLTGITAGNYTLTVTDKNNCTTTLNTTVTQNTAITIDTVTTPITCYGDNNASITISLSGGVAPYQIHWSNLATGTFLPNLSAGTYTVTITDAVGCQKTMSINIPEAKLFTIVPVTKNVTCNGAHNGSIKLNILGTPLSVTWSDGSTAGNERNNLGPGSYGVSISDGTPCVIDTTFIITEPQPLTVSGTITDALDCSNVNTGAITLTVTGGTVPYKYAWSNGAATKDLSNIPEGTYVVTVKDANGCSQIKQYYVSRPQPINISVNATYDYNCTTKYLQEIFTASVTGGVPPYTYAWSAGNPIGPDHTTIGTSLNGLFIFTATDSRGCTATYTVTSNVPILGMDLQLLDCNKKLYAYNTELVNTNTENYTFLWDFGDGTTSMKQSGQHTYVTAGTYQVSLTVTGKSCTDHYQQTIYVADPPILMLTPDPKFCKGDSLVVYASGAHTYKWSNGSTLDSLLLTQAAQYSVVGTSEQGCTSTLTFNSEYYDTYPYPVSTDKDQILVSNPTVHLWSPDQTGIYYLWNFGDNTTAEGYDQSHTYSIETDGYFDVSLRVTNIHGCKSETIKRLWIVNDNQLNTFTPNGDGYNDTFQKGWHIKIYNRNGLLLFEGMDGWDGTYKGKLVSADTYFYVVYYMSASGVKTKEGYVTLIRQ